MSGRPVCRSCRLVLGLIVLVLSGLCYPRSTPAQERREREPNSVYSARRAKLASQIDGPIVLWGFTGHEEFAQTYIFEQEQNFYYLTGHNEEGAAVLILPASGPATSPDAPREVLFLPAKDAAREKWNGVRMSPVDPGIAARTGFSTVQAFSDMKAAVEKLAKTSPQIFTILPYEKENGGYPHKREVVDWLAQVAPSSKLKDVRPQISAMRQVKSPGEIAFLKEAIDLSLDGHLAAYKMCAPACTNIRSLRKWWKSTPWVARKRKATRRS